MNKNNCSVKYVCAAASLNDETHKCKYRAGKTETSKRCKYASKNGCTHLDAQRDALADAYRRFDFFNDAVERRFEQRWHENKLSIERNDISRLPKN